MPEGWSVRVDGREAGLPATAEHALEDLARAARSTLSGWELAAFADLRTVGGRVVATVGIGPAHAPVRARRGGRAIEEALAACAGSIRERLGSCARHVADLSRGAPPCEALLETWLLPSSPAGLDERALEAAREQSFLYHLSD